MVSAPVFATASANEPVIIKLPRIEIIGHKQAVNNSAKPVAFQNAVVIKLPRIEVVGQRHKNALIAARKSNAFSPLAQNTKIIKLPRIDVIGHSHPTPPLDLAVEQNQLFLSSLPSMSIAKKFNLLMPYGV